MRYFFLILFVLKVETTERPPRTINWCKPVLYRNPPGDVVLLASFPGSGNTWLRYLLQQATGVATGSIYLDKWLINNGFPGEKVTNGSVLVVKTHSDPSETRSAVKQFTSIILLIRNPKDAILSTFNVANSPGNRDPHISFPSKYAYMKKTFDYRDTEGIPHYKPVEMTFTTYWNQSAHHFLKYFEEFYSIWFQEINIPMYIVHYEDLVKNTRAKLREILNFLNFKFSESDLDCAMKRREGIYRRRHDNRSAEAALFDKDLNRKIYQTAIRVSKRYQTYLKARYAANFTLNKGYEPLQRSEESSSAEIFKDVTSSTWSEPLNKVEEWSPLPIVEDTTSTTWSEPLKKVEEWSPIAIVEDKTPPPPTRPTPLEEIESSLTTTTSSPSSSSATTQREIMTPSTFTPFFKIKEKKRTRKKYKSYGISIENNNLEDIQSRIQAYSAWTTTAKSFGLMLDLFY